MRTSITKLAIIAGVALALWGSLTPAATASSTQADGSAVAPTNRVVECGAGVSIVVTTPAASFNPLTATNDELAANNLPTRPSNSAETAEWTKFVTSPITHGTTCPTAVAGDQHSSPPPDRFRTLGRDHVRLGRHGTRHHQRPDPAGRLRI